MLHTRLMRMLMTSLPYPLGANNPSLVMHISRNPWGRHLKYPKTTLWPTSSITSGMPLRGKHLVTYPAKQFGEGGFSITHNHNYNPYMFWWEDCLLLQWKERNLII